MMKKPLLILMLLLTAALFATPVFYPRTGVVESCVVDGQTDSQIALGRLDNAPDPTHPGEFIGARLYHQSGSLSSPSVENRFNELVESLIPTLVFNGSQKILGVVPTENYVAAVNASLFSLSPLKMRITNFSPATGAITVEATLLDPGLDISNQHLYFYLLENDVGSEYQVTREVIHQSISMPGANAATSFTNTFTINPGWNQASLWAMAYIQLDNDEILQSASTMALPTHSVRAVFDWDPNSLVSAPGSSLGSETFWIFNTGAYDSMETYLVADDAPEDWYFNYCDEEGNCFPGSQPIPLILGAGDSKSFHLNLWVGSAGTATFHFEISSPNFGFFSIPFVCHAGTAVSDLVLQPSLRLENNYPNPFRGGTSFTVNAEKAASASIQVFDLKGRLIAETPSQNLNAGSNRIDWQAPADLASGLYLYRLKDGSAAPRRMLLLR